jgi:DNA repair protein RecN (Recombination protein N)
LLKSLSIKNYALIDSLEISFSDDLNILTGETGAGKSILLGAIGLIIGQRADSSVLRDKSVKCIAEGVFSIGIDGLEEFFVQNELDYDETAILRREISPNGKSRAFINDSPVNVKVLNDLGNQLIDIHSQFQNLELSEKNYQLRLVDLVAGNESNLDLYKLTYHNYLINKHLLKETLEKAAEAKNELDYFEFQYQQLSEARLKSDEQEELEQQLEVLTHAGEIKTVFGQANQIISDDDPSVTTRLRELLNSFGKLRQIIPEAEDLYTRLDSVYIELKDIASESLMIADKTTNDPGRVEIINQRLDLIYSLQQKHRVKSVDELLAILEDLKEKIDKIFSYDHEIDQLNEEIKSNVLILNKVADGLSQNRNRVIENIEKKVIEMLRSFGIPNASFIVKIERLNDFSATGLDEVVFLFSANKNQEVQDIAKVASGGEMSRLMLAVKSLINDSRSIPTIIFDEIDTGVSGEVAIKMGNILAQMARTVQVLNITHLPQIASKGKHHYKVYKYDEGDQTFTSIRKLTEDERVEEIAQMLSGENYSQTTVAAAKELLQ